MDVLGEFGKIEKSLLAAAERDGFILGCGFEITASCNMACRMCYVRRGAPVLSGKRWLAMGRELVEQGLLFCLITGGEPLTHPDFKEIYTGLRRMGVTVSVNTNGTLLAEEHAAVLEENMPKQVSVSLYGASNATYERLGGLPDGFDRAMRGIRILQEHKVPVRLTMSLTPYNIDDLPAVRRIAEELGLTVHPSPYLFLPHRIAAEEGARLSPEQAAELLLKERIGNLPPRQAAEMLLSLRKLCQVGEDEEVTMSSYTCRGARVSAWLSFDGRLSPCGITGEPSLPLEPGGVKETWRQLRDAAEKPRMADKCARCAERLLCPRCAAAALCEGGSFDAVPEYTCALTAAFVRRLEELANEEVC